MPTLPFESQQSAGIFSSESSLLHLLMLWFLQLRRIKKTVSVVKLLTRLFSLVCLCSSCCCADWSSSCYINQQQVSVVLVLGTALLSLSGTALVLV